MDVDVLRGGEGNGVRGVEDQFADGDGRVEVHGGFGDPCGIRRIRRLVVEDVDGLLPVDRLHRDVLRGLGRLVVVPRPNGALLQRGGHRLRAGAAGLPQCAREERGVAGVLDGRRARGAGEAIAHPVLRRHRVLRFAGMARAFDPCSDAAVRLLSGDQVAESPRRLVENVRDAVAAFRNGELRVREVLRPEQVDRREVADDAQVVRTAVVVGRIVPAAGKLKLLRV